MKIQALVLIVMFVFGIYMGTILDQTSTTITYETIDNSQASQTQEPQQCENVFLYTGKENITYASMRVPAVDDNKKGVISVVMVQIVPGLGQTLTNIDKILFWVDTQTSIKTARRVAERVTGRDMSKIDLVYSIDANASVIEGPSAGAALTITTIAALKSMKVREDVLMTGTINLDGTIGPVGEVVAKADAAKSFGATTFIVPYGLGYETQGVEKKEVCAVQNGVRRCEIQDVPNRVNIGDRIGIKVVEARTIDDAMKYFFE